MGILEPDLNDVPNRVSVRTDPDAGYADRFKTILEAQHALDETSKTKGILGACRHVDADHRAKRRTLEFLAKRLPPRDLAEVCERLSTSELQVGIAFDSDEDGVDVRVGQE